MAITAAQLEVVITTRGIDDLERGMSRASKSASGFGSIIQNAVGVATGIGFVKAAEGIAGLGKSVIGAGLSFNSLKQQAEIAFTTMLGSADAAKAHIAELMTFAAKTPFESKDLIGFSQKLQAMGFEAKQVIPTMTAIGDAVAGLGGSAATMDRVVLAIGQMRAKGKVSAEEMMQLTEAGIPAWDILAKKIGTDVPTAMKQAEKGTIDAKTAVDALITGMEERFPNMMDKQSHSFQGLMSTVKDTFSQFSGAVMGPLFEQMTGGLEKLTAKMSDPRFLEFGKRLGEAFGEGASFIIGKATEVVGFFQDHWGTISTILGKGWDILTTVAVPAFTTIKNAVLEAATFIQTTWVTARDLLTEGWDRIGPAVTTAKDAIINGLTEAKAWIDDQWGTVRSILADGWADIAPKVGEAKTAIVDGLTEAKNWITENWPAVKETLIDAFEGAVPRIQTALDQITEASQNAAASVQQHWPEAQSALGSGWDAVSSAAQPVFDLLVEQGGRVVTFFQDEWPNIQTAATNVFEGIKTNVGPFAVVVMEAATQIHDHWSTIWAAVEGEVKAVWAAISGVVQGGVSVILGALKVVIDVLAGDWAGAWNGAKMAVDGAVQVLDALSGGTLTRVGTALQTAAGVARDTFGPAFSTAASLASSLASGIDQTVAAAGRALGPLQALADKAQSLGNAIRSGLSAILPGSPTEVEIGLTQTMEAMIHFGQVIRTESGALGEWANALRTARLELYNLTPFTAEYAAQQETIKILQAEVDKRKQLIAIYREQADALQESRTALEGFQQAQAAASELGPMRGLMDSLSKALVDDSPQAGAALYAGLDKALQTAKKLAIPGWQEAGQEIQAAIAAALASPSPESVQAVSDLMAGLNDQIVAAQQAQADATKRLGTLTAENLGNAISDAMRSEGIKNLIGSSGVSLLQALDDAVGEGGAKAIQKAGEVAAGISSKLEGLPDFLRGQLGGRMRAALDAFATEPTEEARAALVDVLGDIQSAFELLPKGLDQMLPDVQAAVRAIVQTVVDGGMSAADGAKAIASAIDDAKERAKDAADSAKQTLDSMKRDISDFQKFYDKFGYDKSPGSMTGAQAAAAASGASGGGGGGGTGGKAVVGYEPDYRGFTILAAGDYSKLPAMSSIDPYTGRILAPGQSPTSYPGPAGGGQMTLSPADHAAIGQAVATALAATPIRATVSGQSVVDYLNQGMYGATS